MIDGGFLARVSGLEFTGRRFDHRRGFYVRDVDGILAGGDVSPTNVSQPDGDGQFDLPNRRTDPRIITLTGFAYAENMRELGMLTRQLSGLLADPTSRGEFSWVEFGEWFHATVRRGSGARTVRRGSTGYADFTIRFRAPSQRFYGEATEFPGSAVTVFHRGNYSAIPVVDVPGPHSGFTIAGPDGRTFAVSQSIGGNQVHQVNMRTGRVLLDGVPQTGVTSSGDVWSVPSSARVAMSITGAPSMTVRVADTYI